MDLSLMSDADLDALSKGDLGKVSDEGLQHIVTHPSFGPQDQNRGALSGLDDAITKYFDKPVIAAAGMAGRAIDRFTGAPTRAAISAAQEANTPGDIIPDAIRAGWKQFGADPSIAPTGEQIVDRGYGLEPGSLSSKVAGTAMDVAANPLNLMALTPVKNAMSSVGDWAAEKAGLKTVEAAGATTKDLKKLGDSASDLGTWAKENGLVGPMSTTGAIADNAEALKSEIGPKIGELLKSADAAGAPQIDGAKMGVDLLNDPDIIGAANTPGSESMAAAAERHAETLAKNGPMTLEKAHDLRQGIDNAIRFNKRRADLAPGEQEVLYKIRDSLNNAMNDAVNTFRGNDANELKALNKNYSNASRIADMANGRSAMNAANRTIGLTDTIAGAAGAAMGHTPLEKLVMSGGSALLNKVARTFGDPLQASALWDLSNSLKNPSVIAVPGVGLPLYQEEIDKNVKKPDTAIARRMLSGGSSK